MTSEACTDSLQPSLALESWSILPGVLTQHVQQRDGQPQLTSALGKQGFSTHLANPAMIALKRPTLGSALGAQKQQQHMQQSCPYHHCTAREETDLPAGLVVAVRRPCLVSIAVRVASRVASLPLALQVLHRGPLRVAGLAPGRGIWEPEGLAGNIALSRVCRWGRASALQKVVVGLHNMV